MRYELYYWPMHSGPRRICPPRAGRGRRRLCRRGAPRQRHGRDDADDGGGQGHAAVCAAVPESRQARDRPDRQHPALSRRSRHGLAPKAEAGKLWVHQLQLTIADFVLEVHDTHHPLGPSLYYEDQKAPAKKRTEEFWKERVPKYLGYFEGLLEANGGDLRHRPPADLCRPVAVPDRGGAALRFSEAHEGVRAAKFRAWSTCATASPRGRTSRRIWRASGGLRSTRRASSGGTRSWML